MTEQLRVWLHGRHVADLRRTAGQVRLHYVSEGDELSTSLPSLIEQHPHARVAPWLDGLLPDNEQVIQRWARDMQVAPTTFSLLGSPIGLDCAGAVQFTPDDAPLPTRRDTGIVWLDDGDLADLGAQLYGDRTAWGEAQRRGRFSLAGAQSKVALRLDDGRYGDPYGDEPTNVIVKPSLPGFDDHVVNEHLCLEAARRCGLHAASSRVAAFGAHRVFVTLRFDRVRRGGDLQRVHQEDLCQSLSVPPSGKYQSDGGPTPRAIAERLREVVAPREAERDVRRFFEALVFNWVIVGTDAHAKNYSLLLPQGESPRLAPLYDIGSMAPYEDPLGCKLAMKLGGEYRFKAITPTRNVARAARELGLSEEWAVDRLRSFAAHVVDALADAAHDAGLDEDRMAIRLRDAVGAHLRRHRLEAGG